MAQLNAAVVNFFTQWPDDATLTLIQNRRQYQHDFSRTRIHDQKRLWRRIARNINNAHPNFAPRRRQCKSKWNALKSGYENLKRLQPGGNPEGFPTHRTSFHDEHFHKELSDEFWLVECNYLLFN